MDHFGSVETCQSTTSVRPGVRCLGKRNTPACSNHLANQVELPALPTELYADSGALLGHASMSGVKAVSYDKIGTIQRRLACPCARMTRTNRERITFLNGLLSLVAEHSLCKRKVGGSTPPVGLFFDDSTTSSRHSSFRLVSERSSVQIRPVASPKE